MKQALNFQLYQPSGQLSAFVQGVWSASVPQPDQVMKPLYSDAGSGIVFNLAGNVTIGNEVLPEGVIMLPINQYTQNIVLVPGGQLAGIRFHPAIGYGILGRNYDRPTLLLPEQDQQHNFYQVYSELRMQKDNESQIETLRLWAETNFNFTRVIPDPLEKALEYIKQDKAPGQVSEGIEMSQRQIERLFKLWLGMTPKHYQRIVRIKKVICFLRLRKGVDLAGVAQQFGFSDQAHMTRECRTIARTTPGKI